MIKTPLTEDELDLLRRVAEVQEEEVVNFCIELDIVPDEPFSVDDVVDPAFEALLERARSGGLPISKYDADDLAGFERAEIEAFARGLGVRVGANQGPEQIIDSTIRAMKRVCRKMPPKSQITQMLTYFLPAIVRHFASRS